LAGRTVRHRCVLGLASSILTAAAIGDAMYLVPGGRTMDCSTA
jgi:hypothetical protein